jgi:hypothetical protein
MADEKASVLSPMTLMGKVQGNLRQVGLSFIGTVSYSYRQYLVDFKPWTNSHSGLDPESSGLFGPGFLLSQE